MLKNITVLGLSLLSISLITCTHARGPWQPSDCKNIATRELTAERMLGVSIERNADRKTRSKVVSANKLIEISRYISGLDIDNYVYFNLMPNPGHKMVGKRVTFSSDQTYTVTAVDLQGGRLELKDTKGLKFSVVCQQASLYPQPCTPSLLKKMSFSPPRKVEVLVCPDGTDIPMVRSTAL